MSQHRVLTDWKMWLGVAVSGVALYVTFKDHDFRSLYGYISRIHWWVLLLVVPLMILDRLCRSRRWSLLIENDRSRLRTRYDALNIGFLVTNVLPLRLGEIVRPVLYARHERRSALEILATVATERIFDMLALLTFFVLILPFVPLSGLAEKAPIFALPRAQLFAGAVGLVVLMLGGFLAFCHAGRRISSVITRHLSVKIQNWIDSLFAGIEAPVRQKKLLPVMGWSMTVWLVISLTYLVALYACPSEVPGESLGALVGYSGAVFILVVICFAIAMPSAPGFIGVWHAATWLAFIPYAVGRPGLEESIRNFALVFHLISYLSTILFGLESLHHAGVKWHDIRSTDEAKSV